MMTEFSFLSFFFFFGWSISLGSRMCLLFEIVFHNVTSKDK